jgi:hypothetical protein
MRCKCGTQEDVSAFCLNCSVGIPKKASTARASTSFLPQPSSLRVYSVLLRIFFRNSGLMHAEHITGFDSADSAYVLSAKHPLFLCSHHAQTSGG